MFVTTVVIGTAGRIPAEKEFPPIPGNVGGAIRPAIGGMVTFEEKSVVAVVLTTGAVVSPVAARVDRSSRAAGSDESATDVGGGGRDGSPTATAETAGAATVGVDAVLAAGRGAAALMPPAARIRWISASSAGSPAVATCCLMGAEMPGFAVIAEQPPSDAQIRQIARIRRVAAAISNHPKGNAVQSMIWNHEPKGRSKDL